MTYRSSNVNWKTITASLPVVNQLLGLVTAGLSNTTVYDTAQTSSVVGNATVNATTTTSCCGLIPNVTYSSNTSTANAPFSVQGGNFFLLMINASPPWSDQMQVLQGIAYGSDPSEPALLLPNVLIMVSTLLEIDPSVQEVVAVNMTWEFLTNTSESAFPYIIPYVIQAYFVQCSLSVNTTDGVVDMQTNSLLSPVPVRQPSTQWEMYRWTNNTWQAEISKALSIPVSSGYIFQDVTSHSTEPSIADEYIVSLVGLNLTAEESQLNGNAPPISNFVLGLDQLELAVAKAAAQLVWIAGRIGMSNGGLQPGNGMAYVNEEFVALRLNVNLLPLSFAASASVIMLALALHMTRAFDALQDSEAAIPNIGALQLLWLGHHSVSISEVLEDVKHPTEAGNLRRAGMIDVSFAKTISDEEGLVSSTDSLW
ncbi:hypothetical protein DFH29DRAFT_1082968 [Suillus ampliporus]|nr:hypothetical protein DFH29DRAFT_1082968 [Suillus ampliporus]